MVTAVKLNPDRLAHFPPQPTFKAKTIPFLPIVRHNRKFKIYQENLVKKQFEFVYFGNEYDSLKSIFSIYSGLTKKSNLDKLHLLSTAQSLGINILNALTGVDFDPVRETIYFDVFSFENWLEIGGVKISSLPPKYVPYLAVRKKANQRITKNSDRDGAGLIKVS